MNNIFLLILTKTICKKEMKFEDQCCKIKSKHMGVARIFQRGGGGGGHTESYRGYSLDCHLNSQDFSKGGGTLGHTEGTHQIGT